MFKEIFYFLQNASVQGEDLGIHNVVGSGTIKYTIIDDDEQTMNLIKRYALYVPTLDAQLISLHHVDQK